MAITGVLFVILSGIALAGWPFGAPSGLSEVLWSAAHAETEPAASQAADPDQDDDTEDEKEKDPCDEASNVRSGSTGPGLHLGIAKGNIWTTVPMLEAFADGETSLELTLTYDSLRADEDRGYGWRHSFDQS